MDDTWKDFKREPSAPHQCMHESEQDGTRCRATAMHNEVMCYAHRCEAIRTVIENDVFLIENLDDHRAIQKAFGDVAHRLACNHIDLKRAQLLITVIRAAARNLRDIAAERREAAKQSAATSNEARPTDHAPASRYPEAATSDLSGSPAEGVSTPGPQPAPIKPPREYTRPEHNYLSTWSITGKPSTAFTRPESLSDQDIEAYLAYDRARMDDERKADSKRRKAS